MKRDTDYSNVLTVRVDTPGLQYDICALLKSFFPEKEIKVMEPGVALADQKLTELPLYMDVVLKSDPDTGRIINGESVCTFPIDPDAGVKNSFKTAFYDYLCGITGRTLPWGNLTGVRPTKLAMTGMRNGLSDEETLDYLKNRYRVSPSKAQLALEIAGRETEILNGLDLERGFSLYLDIPFCPTRCLYCSFTSYPYGAFSDRVDDYLDALFGEIDFVAGEIVGHDEAAAAGYKDHPDTVYIGGGTPTCLDEDRLERLLRYLTERIDTTRSLEFTCEAGRPDSITASKLKILKKYGITRISVNPQTMQQKTLDLIGRRGTPAQVKESFLQARSVGFDNINMDIILGLPGEGEEEVSDTLARIEELGPDSLTVHSLAIKRASALRERLDEIGIDALKNTDKTMLLASQAARRMGMTPYYLYRQKNMSGNFENTGYSLPGREGIYNVLIMEEVQTIIALGAGAITKRVEMGDNNTPVNITRCENPKDLDNYCQRLDEMIERKRQLLL